MPPAAGFQHRIEGFGIGAIGEIEYRFPIIPCNNILGGVVFFNATTASAIGSNTELFDHIQPGVGIGLRVMMSKKTRNNITVDYGFGNKSSGLYFSAGETF